ncbi:hypothetical protein JCGZ_16919 [Jatropha curcas]|uniref:pectinesterase n=1 Tax=Jatropha curcas TaxID=180498 RepID=A0A067L5D5_JATCU|nr:hypothetical protein JCGZ_16919 [Jatropha curcas]
MIGKVVVSGISLILVVGVVIGVVASVHRGESKNSEEITPQMKAVTQICQPTNYKEVCTKTLSTANSTDPKELIKAGILAISDSLSKSMNLSEGLVKEAGNEPRSKLALEDCKILLNNASQELQDIITKMSDSDVKNITAQSDDFRIWLSSIIAYQELCIDGFDHDNDLKAQVRNSTNYGNELTDNVLTILAGISDILKSFGLQLDLPGGTSRKLLGAGGYPTWVSGSDRRLLQIRNAGGVTPNAVVALDGSGKFKSINAAINSCPKDFKGRFVIYVKEGLYNEAVVIPKNSPSILMYGMGFQNTAGPDGHQAVAIRVNSDMSIFYNCRMDGYQDTLLYQAKRQFYRNCVISGTIDFLFGYGAAVIQNSLIIVRKPNPNQFNTVTADGKKTKGENTGLVIHNCRIVPEEKLVPTRLTTRTYLGRPWKEFSTTVVMETQLGDLIQPEGWMPWAGTLFLDTLYYAEYANSGPGANTARRVKWKTFHLLNQAEAQKFTVGAFLPGAAQWVGGAQVPFLAGFK